MLYDDFLNVDPKRYPAADMLPSIRQFNDVLRYTPKYSLSADVMQMVETLSWKRPKSILAGLPVCILPFPKLWVEFLYQDFIDALDRIKGVQNLRHMEDAPAPYRMGYLIEDLGGGYIQATMGWAHRNIQTQLGFFKELLHLCPVGWVMNIAEKYEINPTHQEILEDRARENFPPYTADQYMWEFRNRPDDVTAFLELSTRSYPGVVPYCQKHHDELMATMSPRDSEKYQRLIEFDVGGEWRHVLATLMVLNSKTCVEYETIKRDKLSKSRVRSGKPPVDAYREVKFKLSRVQYNAYMASGRKMEDLAKHLVAAHLKVRKTGVFLWSAHVRGYRGEVQIPKRVVVP